MSENFLFIDVQHGFTPLPEDSEFDVNETTRLLEDKGLLKPIRLFSDTLSLEQLNHVITPNLLWPNHTRIETGDQTGDET